MALEIKTLRMQAQGAMYVSPARICVTADGELCDENDTRAVRLLVGKGCAIPASEAAQYGLIVDAAEAVDALPAAPAASAPDAENGGEIATEDQAPRRRTK